MPPVLPLLPPQSAPTLAKGISSGTVTGRRGFMLGVSAALGALSLQALPSSAHGGDDETTPSETHSDGLIFHSEGVDVAIGIVDAIDVPDRLTLRAGPHRTSITVSPASTTFLWRDKLVNLMDFQVGDEVAASGRVSGDQFIATEITSVLQSTTGVVRFDTGLLTINEWALRLTPETKWMTAAGAMVDGSELDLVHGDRVTVTGRREPDQATIAAALIQLAL